MTNEPIRPIRTEADYRAALAQISELFNAETGTQEGERDAYSEKESSVGFGRDDGASLAGKESAIVLSSIFSRFAFKLAGSTTRSSGSLPRFFAAGFSGGAAFLRTTFPDSCARNYVDPV